MHEKPDSALEWKINEPFRYKSLVLHDFFLYIGLMVEEKMLLADG